MKLFDDRLTRLSDKSRARFGPSVSRHMTTTEFFDKFSVGEVIEVGGRKINLQKRRCEPQNRSHYKAIHMTPNITLKSMNPNGKYYWQTCQNLIFARKEVLRIADELVQLDNEEDKKDYWISAFEENFPDGEGLPPHVLRFYRHYHPEKDPFPVIEEAEEHEEEEDVQHEVWV